MFERKRQQCPRCKSYNLKFGAFSNHCNDCGFSEYLTLWNEGKEYNPKNKNSNIKNLLKKILSVVMIFIFLWFFIVPIFRLNFDLMGYLRTADFASFIILMVLCYAGSMLISGKMVFAFQQPQGQPRTQQRQAPRQYQPRPQRQPQQPPQQQTQPIDAPLYQPLELKHCDICNLDKPAPVVKTYIYQNKPLNICLDCQRKQ